MQIAMTSEEAALFSAFLTKANSYVEFGTGGSTYLAAALVAKSIVSVDSSEEWLGQVRENCLKDESKIQPKLVFANIGPTGDWGRPTDPSSKLLWPTYYTVIWREPESRRADLYLVDGRFRVSSFMSVLGQCRDDSIILIHDFTSRPEYHIVREVAREVAAAGELSVFVPMRPRGDKRILQILDEYAYNPS